MNRKCLGRFSSLMLVLFFVGLLMPQIGLFADEEIVTPEDHFGYKPGTDRMLFDYEELVEYLKKLDASSPRLKLIEHGQSPMGRIMYLCFISSEDNIARLERLKEINKKLALDPVIPDAEREALLEEGKVFFIATLSMHSGEVAPAQALPLIAYDLVTTQDPNKLKWLEDVVYMATPNHNPDGMDMVVHHYRKYKGTKYEGSSLPGVYHKYVGHDNNRDFVTLSQSDNLAVAKAYSTEWYPQVMIEKHQMGSTGPRYFVPPPHDPIAENVDAELWNWTGIFGYNMIRDMTEAGLSGVSQHYAFDDYWPGSTETCIWKNVIGMLTEMASVKYASPIYVEPNELSVRGKGLAEYKKSINMPLPWPGGWWRLSTMMDYEIVSTLSTIKTASLHRKEILEFRNELCKREVHRGKTQAPFYYVLPKKQRDRSEWVGLVNLLRTHGVDVYRLTEDAAIGEDDFRAGDIVVPLAQAYRPFIKEVMERQKFPLRHYTPGGEIIRPYDITSWSLPLHRGVRCVEVKNRCKNFESALEKIEEDYRLIKSAPETYWAAAFPVGNNESFKAAFTALGLYLKVDRLDETIEVNGQKIAKGSFIIKNGNAMDELLEEMTVSPVFLEEEVAMKASPMDQVRVALVETYFHDMDAGWTRYVFDTYNVAYQVVRPGDFEKTDFTKNFDVVVFPDTYKSILMSGKYERRGEYYVTDYPPEYTKGIGKKGMEKLMTFLDKGGLIVSWGGSTGLFTGPLGIQRGKGDKEEFQLPFRDISEQFQREGLYCPGSFVRVHLKTDHPITLGMPEETGVFFRGRPVFRTSIPSLDMDRRVIGRFPEEDILLSGYIEKEKLLGDKSVLVWLKKGKGQLVLFGFRPQFRASTQGTYKLLFNAMLLPRQN